MKSILRLVLLFIPVASFAQWTGTNPVYVTSGKVGIGTSSPYSLLSNTTASVGGNASDGFVWKSVLNDWTATIYGAPSSGAGYGLRLHTNGETSNDIPLGVSSGSGGGTMKLFVRGDGNIGINTSSPLYRLSIVNSSPNTNRSSLATGDVGVAIYNNSATANNFSSILFFDANGYTSSGILSQTKSHTNHTGTISLATRNNGGTLTTQLLVDETGNVGIGTTSPDQKLTVNGTVHAIRVKVEATVPTPDYVFEESYALPSLDEVKAYIKENKHLPDVPSAREMDAKGVDVGEMNMLLLKKVEELTLYLLDQKKQMDELKAQLSKQNREIEDLKK